MKDRKILLIGGSGFLGQTIMNPLQREGIPFFYADIRPVKGMEKNFISLNVLDANDFQNLDKDYSVVINLTGQVTNPSNLCFVLNTKGINNIIAFVEQNKINLIQVSTLSVYGSSVHEINEDSNLNPETTYGSCKAMSEFLIQSRLPEDQYMIIRLSNLYGNHQPKGILAYLLKSMKKNDDLLFNNDGSLKRHYLNVDDAANMISHMSTNFVGGSYNYPGDDVFDIKELVSLLEQIGNRSLNVSYENINPWENIAKIDSTKINATFDYRSQYRLIDWLTQQLELQ